MKKTNILLAMATYFILMAVTCPPNPTLADNLRKADMEINGVSISATKPSDVWPPRPGKYWALDCGGTSKKMVDGIETRIVELRGWLKGTGTTANSSIDGDWRDWHYNIEPDLDWCVSKNIDINKLLKVGNVMFPENDMSGVPGYTYSPYASVGEPVVVIEANGKVNTVPLLHPAFPQLPADWTFTDPSASDTKWAFNPLQPLSWQPALADGQYVRIVGSIVTDAPHQSQGWPAFMLLKLTGIDPGFGATSNDAKKIWGAGRTEEDATHAGRWTEMHPPDIISVLSGSYNKVKKDRLIGLALCEDKGLFNPGRSLDVDLIPIGPKPTPASTANIIEMVGPETIFSTITEGQSGGGGSFTGATITKFPDKVHIHVKVKANINSNGKFKALYKVFWN